MDAKQILQRLNKIKDIPTLPTIVFELNTHMENPETSIAKVSETIEKDQALTLKILKLVNSAFFGFKSRVSDINKAVVLLGFNAVRNAIVSVSVINALPKSVLFQDFEMNDFWRHSLAVAVTSKNIAQKVRLGSPDNCFVGGLLHDIGKVIMAQYFQDLFVKVWESVQNDEQSFYQAEQNVLPVDHTMIGAYLAKRWTLPQGLIDAIRWHHDYQPDGPNADFILIIYLANVLVNSYDENQDCEIDLAALHPRAVEFLIGRLGDLTVWYQGLTDEIDAAYGLFLEED